MTSLIEVPDFTALENAEYVAKRDATAGRWEGEIPAQVTSATAKLVADGGALIVKVTDEDAFNKYRSVFIAAARVLDLSANVIRVYADKEKTQLSGARISVGEKRGRKAVPAAE